MVCRVYYNLERMSRGAGGPISENHDWFAENADGPMREIVPELCCAGRTAVGEYLNGRTESGCALRPALPRRPAKKGPREIATKSDTPNESTLYDTLIARIAAVRREGRWTRRETCCDT